MMPKRPTHPVPGLILIWLTVATVAARIETHRTLDRDPGSDAAAVLVEESRQAIGNHMYRSADTYYHRGARARSTNPHREDRLTRLHQAIAPNHHDHLDAAEVAEMLPWLRAALRVDHGNIEAWRVAAFWLASPALGQQDQAVALLLEAARRHPADYRPLLDLARFRLRQGDLDSAIRHLDRGLALWRPDPPRGNPDEARLELAELLTFRAVCHEIAERAAAAAALYDRVLDLFPDRSAVAERRAAIRAGRPPELPPLSWIQDLARHHHPEVDDCDHGAHAHAGETTKPDHHHHQHHQH